MLVLFFIKFDKIWERMPSDGFISTMEAILLQNVIINKIVQYVFTEDLCPSCGGAVEISDREVKKLSRKS